jgi:hypothetical protein
MNNNDDGIKQTLFDRYIDLSRKVTDLKKEYEKQEITYRELFEKGEFDSSEEKYYCQGLSSKTCEIIKDLEEILD